MCSKIVKSVITAPMSKTLIINVIIYMVSLAVVLQPSWNSPAFSFEQSYLGLAGVAGAAGFDLVYVEVGLGLLLVLVELAPAGGGVEVDELLVSVEPDIVELDPVDPLPTDF